MKNNIRIALVIFITIAVFITPVNAQGIFTDINDHWAETDINNVSRFGIVSGPGDGTFKPDDHITRAELATIIDNIMNYQVVGKNTFSDVEDTWYKEAVLKNSKAEVLKGYNGLIRPNDKVSREEAVLMIARAFNIENAEGETSFLDNSHISSWAKSSVKAMTEKSYIKGKFGRFDPLAPITRAETVKIIGNIMGGFYSVEGDYSEDVKGTVIINTPDVRLKDMTITGNLIVAEGVGNGEVFLDNVTVTGDVLVKGGGENSVYFKNTNINGTLEVSKSDGKIRIVSSGSTVVRLTKLFTGAILVESYTTGVGFERIEVPADAVEGSNIEIDGSIDKMSVNSKGTNIDIKKGSKVVMVDIAAEGTKLDVEGKVTKVNIKQGADNTSVVGSGDVDNVNVSADDVAVTTDKTKVTSNDNAKNVTADGKEVKSGKTVITGDSGHSSGGGTTNPHPTNSAPTVVIGHEIQTGTAIPSSRDGATSAVAYSIDVNSWFNDSDNDILSYAVESTTSNDNNSIVINGNTLTYTPASADGDSNIEIQVKANDGTHDSTTNVIITVSVGAVPNSAPTVINGTKSGNATPPSKDGNTSAVAYTATIDNSWFTDSDNDSLSYDVVSTTATDDNSVVINGNTLTYTPASADGDSNIEIQVKANDGTHDSTTNVIITVSVGTVSNSAPSVISGTKSGHATPASIDGNTSAVAYTATIDNSWFTDADGDPLTYSLVSNNGVGTATITGSAITFTPTIADANSSVEIKVKANDNVADSGNVTIAITVDSVPNSQPVLIDNSNTIADKSYSTGEVVSFDTNTYFADPDFDTLSYSISPLLPSGLSLNTNTGEISGTPNAASNQTEYTLTVSDGNGGMVTDSFDISVSIAQGTMVYDNAGFWQIADTYNPGTHYGIWYVEDLQLIDTASASGDFAYGDDGNYLNENYVLMNDIDFNSDGSYRDSNNKSTYTGGSGFDPIGDYTNKFTGDFDGGEHTINNLFINTAGKYAGLFGFGYDVNIKNLGIINADITANQGYVAGFMGQAYGNATFTNCYLEDSSIKAVSNVVAGIIGNGQTINVTKTYVKNTTLECDNSYVGGIVGQSYSSSSLIENCYTTGVYKGYMDVGGFAGDFGGTIRNCYTTSLIDNNKYSAYYQRGGLVGYTRGATNIENTIAMNPEIKCNTNTLQNNRLVGNYTGSSGVTITNTYAFNAMKLYGDGTTVNSSDPTSVDGANMTIDQFLDVESYNNDSVGINLNWDTSIWNIVDGQRPTLIGVGNDNGLINTANYVSLPSSISPTFMYGSIVIDIDGADNNYASYKDNINLSSSTLAFIDDDGVASDTTVNLNALGSKMANDGVITFDGSPIDHYPCLSKSDDFGAGGVLEGFDMNEHDKVRLTLTFTDASSASGEADIPVFGDSFDENTGIMTFTKTSFDSSLTGDIDITTGAAIVTDSGFDMSNFENISKIQTSTGGHLQAYIYVPSASIDAMNTAQITIKGSTTSSNTIKFYGTGGGGQLTVGNGNRPVIVLILKDTGTNLMKPFTCYVESVDATNVNLVPLTDSERNSLPSL